MAAQSASVDFLAQYKAISSKLKKRFLRKPNVAEASEQFSLLAKQLQQDECTKYAAFTCLALARCEQSISNSSGEAQALVQAARLYMKEEQENYDLKFPTYDENLNSAINCYHNAIRVHLEQKNTGLAVSLALELANALKCMGKTSEAVGYYVQAAELLTQSPAECLSVLDQLTSCYIEMEDYDRALALLSDMAQMIVGHGCSAVGGQTKCVGAFADLSAKVEILRVLLLLLLHPGPQRLSADHSQLLEKYAWESKDFDSSTLYFGEDLFLLLQSFVMAHQSSDLNAMVELQKDLWPHLTGQQNNLIFLIIDMFQNPESYQIVTRYLLAPGGDGFDFFCGDLLEIVQEMGRVSFIFLALFVLKKLLVVQMVSNCRYTKEVKEITGECLTETGVFSFDLNLSNNFTRREQEAYYKFYQIALYCLLMRLNWTDSNYISSKVDTLNSINASIIANDALKDEIHAETSSCYDSYSYRRADTTALIFCLKHKIKQVCGGEPQ